MARVSKQMQDFAAQASAAEKSFKTIDATTTKIAATLKTVSGESSKLSQGPGGGGGSNSAGYQAAVQSMQFMQPGTLRAGQTTPGGFAQPSSAAGPTFGQKALNIASNIAQGAAVSAMQAMVPENYAENEMSRRRFAFFSGQSRSQTDLSNPNDLGLPFQAMMNKGTAISTLDAARAAMAGASAGMMPGLGNYNTITNSVAGISNMMPGAGLEASMGAVTALNQGRSVNMLRMIGINVRNSNGMMRDVEDIARDLWNSLNRQKQGAGKITAKDLSYSLQPGMSLDMMLNQYFNGDPVLRQAVVSYLFQFAGTSGSGEVDTRAATNATNASNDLSNSIARRNASGYNMLNKNTDVGVQGQTDANNIMADTADNFADAVDQFGGWVIQALNWMSTVAGGANGSIGTFGTAVVTSGSGGEGVRSIFGGGVGGEGVGPSGVASGMYAPLMGSLSVPKNGGFKNNASFRSQPHRGIDYKANLGDPVFAIKDGTVKDAGNSGGDLGNRVRIAHSDGKYSVYAHLSAVNAKVGDKIKGGTKLGEAGYTGAVNPKGPSGTHLHLAIENSPNGTVNDPVAYLGAVSQPSAEGVYASADTPTSSNPVDVSAPVAEAGSPLSSGVSLFKKSGGSLFNNTYKAGAGGEGVGGTGSMSNSTYYGGVTVHINVPKGTGLDENKLAQEIKKVLRDEDSLRMAVSR